MIWETILKRLRGDRFLMRRINRAYESLNYEKLTFTRGGGRLFDLFHNLTLDELGNLLMDVIEEIVEDLDGVIDPQGLDTPELIQDLRRPSMEGFNNQLRSIIVRYFSQQRVIDLVSKYPNDMVLTEYVFDATENRTFKFIDGSPEMYAKIVEESEEHRRPIE